ncbi:hypothetical protein CKA32_002382 [Geitlerinema sp. FC II]|nr:hypothetical protein [Geitlerinema sp. CS-897]PPT09458.1 hypothetical protein CKA32_002382 [Geitlerinema sp. FC II]
MSTEKDYCFCSIAISQRYRDFAKNLAAQLREKSPGTSFVVFSDRPEDFQNCENVIAFKHAQQGIQRCSNDRRFLIEKALSMFRVAIHIDADTELVGDLPEIEWKPGITARSENLLQHVGKYRPQNLPDLKRVAEKLDIPEAAFDRATWIGEALYIVARDEGREIEFVRAWDKIARYMELKGMYSGDGNLMGLAAAKVGWTARLDGFKDLAACCQHLDASYSRPKPTLWQNLSKRLGYHYRLNRARLRALKEFDFYYR